MGRGVRSGGEKKYSIERFPLLPVQNTRVSHNTTKCCASKATGVL